YGVESTIIRVGSAVEMLGPDASPADRLRTAIRAHLSSNLHHSAFPAAFIRIHRQVPPDVQKRYFGFERRYGEFWHEILVAAREAGEIRSDIDIVQMRLFIVGSLNWVVEWPPKMRTNVDELAHTLESLLFDGLNEPVASEHVRSFGEP